MADPHTIRNWLIQRPPPAILRMTTDGDVEEVTIGNRSKARLAESIVAKGPDLLELLDSGGKFIRAMRLDVEPQARSAYAPEPPEAIRADPQAALLTHFANLVHRAYEHASDIAFAKLVELVERMETRSQAIEERLERTEAAYRREQRERIDDLYDVADEAAARAASGEPSDQILAGLASGILQGQHEAKSNGKGQSS